MSTPTPPRSIRSRVAASSLAVLVLATLIALAGALLAPRASADPDPAAASRPLAEFSSCLAGGGHGQVVLLLDQSGSLAKTDPEKARVRAGQFLVGQLAELSERTGYPIDVQVAGFAADYAAAGDWVTLSGQSAPQLDQQISAVGDDLRTHDTDYWTALESARQALADHDAAPACSAIFWFSDGEYDIDPRTSADDLAAFGEEKVYARGVSLRDEAGAASAVEAGRADLCRPAGLADQIRSSGITLVGIGLTSEGTDLGFMQGVATGGDGACGELTSPQGSYFPADDLDSLLMAFDALSVGDTLRSQQLELCQGAECASGEAAFVLDSSIDAVSVVASADVDGVIAYVIPPGGGQPIRFPSTDDGSAVEEGGLTVRWISPHTVSIGMSAGTAPAWDGTWRVGFLDPASSSAGQTIDVNLHISSPLTLQWVGVQEAQLRQGETAEDVPLRLVSRTDGSEIDPASIAGTLSGSLTLVDAAGEEHVLVDVADAAQLTGPLAVTIPDGVALGGARLDSTLQLTTAAPSAEPGAQGTALDPAEVSVRVEILPPSNYPIVGREVAFGIMEGEPAAEAQLEVTGPGCVWLDPAGTALSGVPADAGTVAVSSDASSAETCVAVDEGGTGTLPLTLTADQLANGGVRGTITVMIAPATDLSAARAVTVPVEAEMRRPLDVAAAGAAFAVILLLGIGIPLLLLYLLTWWSARIPRGLLVTGSAIVEVPAPGARAHIELDRRDLTLGSLASPQRSVSVAGRTLKARMGLLPTEAPRVELAGDAPSISSADPGMTPRGRARLPLGVRGQWIAVRDQADPRLATVLVLLGGEDQASLDRVLEDAASRLGDRVRALDARTGGGGAAAAGGDAPAQPAGWGGGSSSAPASSGWGSSTSSSASAGGQSGWGSPSSGSSSNPPSATPPASQPGPSAPPASPPTGSAGGWGDAGGWGSPRS